MFISTALPANWEPATAVIYSPEDTILKYTIRLHFSATNNVAEYKAILTGMDFASNTGADVIALPSRS